MIVKGGGFVVVFMGVIHYNGYVAGWLDSLVLDFLADFPRSTENAAYALITCLDSGANPASILESNAELRSELNGYAVVKKGLLIPTAFLRKTSLRYRLFVGFDEVWFFPTAEIEPKPPSISIVGPKRVTQESLDVLGPWMDRNGCSLALGDGGGLNVIVRAYGLVRHFVAHSLAQPEPMSRANPLWVQDEEKQQPQKKARRRRTVEKA